MNNIMLVHGAWADSSGWHAVHDLLCAHGYRVSMVQNPLTSFADDVAATDRVLSRQEGITLMVGHAYGGAVITQAGNAANVAGLVYVAAFVPDAGESVESLIEGEAPVPLQPSADGFLFFNPTFFPRIFAHDLTTAQGAFLAASQVPPARAAFSMPVSQAAWRSRPSWYVLATEDRVIPPTAQRQMATRANATITAVRASHALHISQPRAVAETIARAARAADPASGETTAASNK
jgi:pimeloyl-ACP methyl ester carboxylesterase